VPPAMARPRHTSSGVTIRHSKKLADAAWALLLIGTAVAVFGRRLTPLVLLGVSLWSIGIVLQAWASIQTLQARGHLDGRPPVPEPTFADHFRFPDLGDRPEWLGHRFTMYRSRGGSTWHFCTNCHTAPTSDFDVYVGPTPPDPLCNECLHLQAAGSCSRPEPPFVNL
jgi:hypothetical protein